MWVECIIFLQISTYAKLCVYIPVNFNMRNTCITCAAHIKYPYHMLRILNMRNTYYAYACYAYILNMCNNLQNIYIFIECEQSWSFNMDIVVNLIQKKSYLV